MYSTPSKLEKGTIPAPKFTKDKIIAGLNNLLEINLHFARFNTSQEVVITSNLLSVLNLCGGDYIQILSWFPTT